MNVVTNFTVDGMPYPPSTTDVEAGGTRVEIVPSMQQKQDYFLNVLQITDASDASPPTATMTQDATTVTANIGYKGATFTLTFDKSGPMGGHITAKETDGTTCDENLGASGSTPDGGAPGSDGGPGAGDGGGGGGGSSGGGSGDGGANAASGGSGGGCGCTAVGDGPTSLAAVAALGLLALGFTRRSRGAPRRRSTG
jgi:MYXO-CTERM domain-containing protein